MMREHPGVPFAWSASGALHQNVGVLEYCYADSVTEHCQCPGTSEYLEVGVLTFSHSTAGVL